MTVASREEDLVPKRLLATNTVLGNVIPNEKIERAAQQSIKLDIIPVWEDGITIQIESVKWGSHSSVWRARCKLLQYAAVLWRLHSARGAVVWIFQARDARDHLFLNIWNCAVQVEVQGPPFFVLIREIIEIRSQKLRRIFSTFSVYMSSNNFNWECCCLLPWISTGEYMWRN